MAETTAPSVIASLSEALYAGGAQDPHLTYSLKPVPSEGITDLTLRLDGQVMTASAANAAAKQFTWPGAAVREARASVRFGGTDLGWVNNAGLWAVFQFFEEAERTRRWNVFNDIPWDQVNRDAPEELALCAETFASVELYLPDYVAQGINVVRPYFGRAWFQANWGYEESKHALALGEYLVRSGKRTQDQWLDHQQGILAKEWTRPFETARHDGAFPNVVQKSGSFRAARSSARHCSPAAES